MPIRVAIFGSYYYGLAMLETLLSLQKKVPREIEIVGVASDDPAKAWVRPDRRLWRLPHTKEEEEMVANLAAQHGIPVWRGQVKTEEFRAVFKQWMPDVCYMGIFGQRIPEAVWTAPLYGFYNFHSCAGKEWPSNTGAQAFESMADAGEQSISTAMHTVDNEYDHGPLVAFSQFLSFSAEEGVMETFKRTRSLVAGLMGWHLAEILRIPAPQMANHISELFEVPVHQVTPRIIAAEQMSVIRGEVILGSQTGRSTEANSVTALRA